MLVETSSPRYCAPPSFAMGVASKPTAAQAEGLRYEEKFLDHAVRWASGHGYRAEVKPWISYTDLTGKLRFCQPDLLLLSDVDDNLLVIEVKNRHTRDAFKQLKHYCNLMRLLHKDRTPSGIEVCRFFDMREYPVELIGTLRPHDYPRGAAVIWDPRYEGFNA